MVRAAVCTARTSRNMRPNRSLRPTSPASPHCRDSSSERCESCASARASASSAASRRAASARSSRLASSSAAVRAATRFSSRALVNCRSAAARASHMGSAGRKRGPGVKVKRHTRPATGISCTERHGGLSPGASPAENAAAAASSSRSRISTCSPRAIRGAKMRSTNRCTRNTASTQPRGAGASLAAPTAMTTRKPSRRCPSWARRSGEVATGMPVATARSNASRRPGSARRSSPSTGELAAAGST